MRNMNAYVAICIAGLLAGCASPTENVLFVTKTSLGIDLDGAPATASIAYDRIEGYVGPRFENGSLPPVIAKISTDGHIFDRNVRQYYATGNAANLLAGSEDVVSKPNLEGEARPMFFGTSTTMGIKIGFTTSVPDSFTLGYKRKEVSVIPIATVKSTTPGVPDARYYPSVIGVFGTDIDAKGVGDTKFGLAQFFATGSAAQALAKDRELSNDFKSFAKDAVEAFKDGEREQQRTILSLLRCFGSVPDNRFAATVGNANELKLLDPGAYTTIQQTATSQIGRARGQYITAISIPDAKAPNRTGLLEGHRVYVCGLVG